MPALAGNEQSWFGPHSVYWTAVPSSTSTWFATFVVLAILIVWPSTCRAPPEIWASWSLPALPGSAYSAAMCEAIWRTISAEVPLGVHGHCAGAGGPGFVSSCTPAATANAAVAASTP